MNDNMKYTRDLLDSQERVLVQVIRFLDSSGYSEQPIRDLVDTVLNHMKTAKQLSREELDEAENAKA